MNFFSLKSALLLTFATFFIFSQGKAQNKYLSFVDRTVKQRESEVATPTRVVNLTKTNAVEIKYTFSGAFISEEMVNSELYKFIQIEGFNKMGQVGAPALPVKNEVVALPRGSLAQIELINVEFAEFDGYYIHPALEPALDTEEAKSPEFVKDEKIFSTNNWFPENNIEIISIGLSRGTPLAVVQVTPVQSNPVTRKIRVCTSIEFRITPVNGEPDFDYISRENTLTYTNNLKKAVINSENIPDGISKTMPSTKQAESLTPKNYIIITHSEYIDEVIRLANWKRQLGYSVEVVSRSSWTAEDVKAVVHERYGAWTPKPDYMLIFGDHTGDFAVPGELHPDPIDGSTFATDLYYVCMDGRGDHVPDMAKGRISVSSLAEATIIVDKIINYEKTPPTSSTFYENVLNLAQYQDTDDNDGYADRRFCHTSEEIRDYLQDEQGYASTRVYYRETGSGTAGVDTLRYNNGYYSDGQLLPSELRSPTFNWNGGASEITSEIDAGKLLVFHRDHGYVGGSGWAHPYYTTTSMSALSNGELLPVVFSMNCHTGEFQLPTCFAEKFLRMENKGAVGVIAAAYYSYSGYNDAISIGMIDAIWPDPGLYPEFGTAGSGSNYTMGGTEGIYTLGDVLNQGLYAMTQNFWDNTYTFELFHYFGDPAMKIWTANPNDSVITATHNTTINCEQSNFAISGSQPSATATLVCNNKLVGKTILDTSGNGTITYTLSTTGDVILTVSKHNCVPYISTITQICLEYPPEVSLLEATNVTENSATLGGIINDDHGNAIVESGVLYGTTSNIGFGQPGVTQLQTSPVVTADTILFDLTSLTSLTTYYFMAYAINAVDTGYSEIGFFNTSISGTEIVNIPDANFKALLVGNVLINTNEDDEIQIEEAENFNGSLSVYSKGIFDLTGIEYFTSLTSLYLTGNYISTVNVSNCSTLERLRIYNNNNRLTSLYVANCINLNYLEVRDEQLTELDISNCFSLEHLDCDNNQLTSLDISSSPDLMFLSCSNNNLNNINISNSHFLEEIYCDRNNLRSIDLSGCLLLTKFDGYDNQLLNLDSLKSTFITYLNCKNNQIGNLDLSPFSQLTYLNCENNQLTHLNLDNCHLLTSIYSAFNQISDLDLTPCPNLVYLYCNNNDINSIDLSLSPNLVHLECSSNQLSALDISNNNLIERLYCSTNQLTSLNLTNLTELLTLYCNANQLTGLDLCNCPNITSLRCTGNNLSNINPENCQYLSSLYCDDNILDTVDVSGCINLVSFYCSGNQISRLDLSNNYVLRYFTCDNNQLTALNIKNGNNSNFPLNSLYFNAINNPLLSCVTVDNIDYSNANWTAFFDESVVFSLDCEDETAPALAETFPANNETDVDISTDLILIFSENVTTTSGKQLTIRCLDDGSIHSQYDATECTGSGNDTLYLYVNPDFDPNKSYYVLIDNGAFSDMQGNAFEGISDPLTWSFTTNGTPNSQIITNTYYGDGEDVCFSALHTITVAGDGTPVDFLSGSTVNLIAGESINFLPGFHAHNGSYMYAWITTEGTFCDAMPEQSIVEYSASETFKSSTIESIKTAPDLQKIKPFTVSLYPNPCNGIINIQTNTVKENISLMIYDSTGTIVYKNSAMAPTISLNMQNLRNGIYFIQVVATGQQKTLKFIIQ